MIEAVAWGLGLTGVSASIAIAVVGVAKVCKGNQVCKDHANLLSRIAGMQQGVTILATYTIDRATQEGRDLLKEVMELLMKKG